MEGNIACYSMKNSIALRCMGQGQLAWWTMDEAALEHGVAIGTAHPVYIDSIDGLLVGYTVNPFNIGRRAARLASQIFQGIAITDLPVETADGFLVINLKTANAIGVDIPDDVLALADNIIRGDE